MDNDDEINPMTATIAPNHFLLSTYKDNIRANNDNFPHGHVTSYNLNVHGNVKTAAATYKCCLCRKIVDDATLTCAQCVNTGRFCPSKHDTCSHKRRQALTNLLNQNDYDDFQQYSAKNAINTPAHLQCSDRMYLLKHFNNQSKLLRTEYENRLDSVTKKNKIIEEIVIRKNRLHLACQLRERLREQIEKKKIMNENIRKRNNYKRSLAESYVKKIEDIKTVLNYSNNEIRKKNDIRIDNENKLLTIRRQRINEIFKYIFPIEHLSLIEDDLVSTMRALSSAQQPIAEETSNEWPENDESMSVEGDRFQIVNSRLSTNGDYQISKLLLTLEVESKTSDADSLQSTISKELYELLSALSHACQLINVIAFYLHIALPFRLHQLEFNGDNLTTDRLRADIAKLNANIVSGCLSQGIPIEDTDVTHTLENLWKLLTFKRYLSRPQPVVYSQQYIDMMEEEVNEISRAYVTDYWFDDVEKDVTDLLNSDEWETVPHDYNIPEDPFISDTIGSLPSISSQQNQQHLSVMSGSIDFLKWKGSNLFHSVFRSLSKS